MNSVVRITDHPNMTSAVNSGLKTTNQTEKKQILLLVLVVEAEYRILQVLSLAAINYSKKVSATYLEFIQSQVIMLTCSCNLHPFTPHFYIVKLGFTFLIFALKHRLWVLVRSNVCQ